MDVKISVDNLVDFLVLSYREMIEDDMDICVKELVENWPDVTNANYDSDNDCVNFTVSENVRLPSDLMIWTKKNKVS